MKRRSLSSFLTLFVLLFAGFATLIGCGGGSKPTVTIGAPASTTIDPGDAVTLTATVENSGGEGVTWTLSGSGCSASACGALSNQGSTSVTYTAPTQVAAAFSVTITATSAKESSVTSTVTLNVPANPAITTTVGALTAGQVGSTYSATVAVSGGISPYTWKVTSGNLPAGLTLGAGSGTISGTPAASGNYTFTLQVTDSGSPTALTASGQFSISIAAAPAITFTTTTLPNGIIGTAYNASVAATGGAGALTYAVTSGSLPAKLSLSSAGAITGTPSTAGTSSFKVTASDGYGDTGTGSFSITVNYPQLTVTTSSLPTGYAGSTYPATTLAASGGSNSGYGWTWAAASGSSLPAGLNLSAAGVITGKPTTAGSYSVVVTVTDSASNTANATLSLTVDAAVSVTTASLPTGYAKSVYPNTTLDATGGAGSPYTWTWAAATGSSLPAGLSLSSGGVLSGTPTTAGAYSVVVTAEDSAKNTGSATLTLTVDAGITISPGTVPGGYQGTPYVSTTLTASGGSGTGYSFTWAAASGSSLPPGLSLSAGGTISGTPTAAGSYSVVVTVKDSANNTAQATYSITIEATIAITTTTLPTGYANSAYPSTTLAATGGSGGFTWTWAAASGSSLPAGLSLSTGGVITGTPTTAGAYSVVVTVKDSASHTQTATLTLTVNAGVSVTTASLPAGYVSSAYTSTTLAATGGAGSPYTWTWAAASGSSLPGGLNLSSAGVISGTPTTAGTYSVVVTAKDSVGNTGSATLSIAVKGSVSISTTSLPSGYQGTAYTSTQLVATGGSGTGYTWTWAAGSGSSIPAGLSLSTGGIVSGTPTAAGTFSVVVTVKDSANNTAQATFSIAIEATLAISTASPLPSGTVNVNYSQTLAATGGSGTGYTWSTTGTNTLATVGLSFSGGTVSGKPSATGTASFTAVVTDSQSHTAQTTFSVTVYNALTVTTTTLQSANQGAAYSQTVQAAGGTGTGYTWSATGSNLSTFGLSFSSAGVVSGTPTASGTASFTANVKDSGGNTASQALSITIYSALSQDASGLPLTGTTGVGYNGTVEAVGGSGNYCWSSSGLPADGLSGPRPNTTNPACPFISPSFPISGTPTGPATVVVRVTLTDGTTGASVTDVYTIVITNPAPLTLPAPNPGTLPAATQNQSYTGSITATGGVAPYTWSINGTTVSGSTALSDGLSASASGETLSVTGTPTSTGSVSLTNVTITDSEATPVTAGPDTYTIAVNAPSQISGQVFLNNAFYCGTTVNVPPVTVTLSNTSGPVSTQTTNSSGGYSFTSLANGTYTVTPTLPGAESVFFPAKYSGIVISGNSVTENFSADIGYTVSGSVSYSGGKSGQVYINMEPTSCNGISGTPGTSISETTLTSGGAFTIRGVPPGSYQLSAWMDPIGQGQQNTEDPSGTSSTIANVTDADVTGIPITLTNPSLTTPTTAPNLKGISPTNGGVVISYGGGSISNGQGIEEFTSYTVQWSTSSSSFSGGSATFQANGRGADIWILNGAIKGITGSFTNGTSYYFRVRGANPAGNGPWTYWAGPGNSCNTGSCATTVTIGAAGAGSGWNEVSGTVTIPSSVTINAGAVLYTGFYDQNSNTAYATAVTTPTTASPNSYTVYVPTGSNYIQFGILDQNADGLIDIGDVNNVNTSGQPPTVNITGPLRAQDLTLPNANSSATVGTSFSQITYNNSGTPATTTGYNLNFKTNAGVDLPVAVTLASGPNVMQPIDLGNACQGCGSVQFDYYVNAGATPKVGDTYTFDVTYSTTPPGSGTDTAVVSSVLGTSQAASALAPNPSSVSVSTTPTFTWTYPANPGNYIYQFQLQDNNGNMIWSIPNQNSSYNGFTSTQIPMPGGLAYGVDPTDSTNTPALSALAAATQYEMTVTTIDANGNQANIQTYFITQ